MSQPHSRSLPTIPLDQGGLRTIDSIIQGYLPHLARNKPVPTRTIAVLQEIRRKLTPLLQPGGFPEGTAIPLTLDELWALDIALQGFASLLSHHISPSRRRDATLAELQRLHLFCKSLLSSQSRA